MAGIEIATGELVKLDDFSDLKNFSTANERDIDRGYSHFRGYPIVYKDNKWVYKKDKKTSYWT